MAKILVPETGSQLFLSFEGRPYRATMHSLPNVSSKLSEQVFGRVHGLNRLFRPLNFTMIASAIRASGGKNVYFVGKERQAIGLRQLIVNIVDEPSPKAIVALNMNLEGPSIEVEAVWKILLSTLKVPWKLRPMVGLRDGHLAVTVSLDPIARIDVGTFETPPVTHSFVLREEIAHLLPQLTALGRPYQVVVAA